MGMAEGSRQIKVNPLSWISLLIKSSKNNCFLAQASGFVIKYDEKYHLITNWHVLAHRFPDTERLISSEGDFPDRVNIYHHVAGETDKWIIQGELLFETQTSSPFPIPRWISKRMNDTGPGYVDVVALPLKGTPPSCSSLLFCPLDLSSMAKESDIAPGMLVYIIGYPEGINVGTGECIGGAPHGGWPIWITGHIASDPGLDYEGRPVYLVNASTGGGLSGAPVFVQRGGEMKFLGVYSAGMSSKYSGERVVGMGEVWRARIVEEILKSA
jgi:hypothetical protein